MRIGVMGVGASRNVGDGLIAACIEATIKSQMPESDVQFFDFNEGPFSIEVLKGAAAHRALNESVPVRYWPRALKNGASIPFNKAKRKAIRDFGSDKDIIIIGGGHILIDNFLNFPLHIYTICELLHKKNIIFWAVGASEKQSWAARWLLKRALSGKLVYTRDSNSSRRLISSGLVPTSAVKSICDPAFFSEMLPVQLVPKPVGVPIIIGVNIMDPLEMMRHSRLCLDRERTADWWVRALVDIQQQFDIRIFCNGNQSDWAFINAYIRPRLGESVQVMPPPSGYADLIKLIEGCDVLVCQRLHSVIPAISLSKRFIAFAWDTKVSDILRDAGIDGKLLSYDDDATGFASRVQEEVLNLSAGVPSTREMTVIKNRYICELGRALA